MSAAYVYKTRDEQLDIDKALMLKSKGLTQIDELYYDLLMIRSPSGKEQKVRALIKKTILPWLADPKDLQVDGYGNLWCRVGDGSSKIIFSCHMDTMHRDENRQRLVLTTDKATEEGILYAVELKSEIDYINLADMKPFTQWQLDNFLRNKTGGPNKSKIEEIHDKKIVADVLNKVGFNPAKDNPKGHPLILQAAHKIAVEDEPLTAENRIGYMLKRTLESKRNGSILGADDKTGCFIMLKMIQKKIPGMYIFHVGEESGCQGSKWIASNAADILKDYKIAVAFDRKGYNEVITKQAGSVCCSDEFATGLAKILNQTNKLPPKEQFRPSPNGVYTDTATYMPIIPECTNLGVGYFDQHTTMERQDWAWLSDFFLPAVLEAKWHELPVARDPKKKPADNFPYRHHSQNVTHSYVQKGRHEYIHGYTVDGVWTSWTAEEKAAREAAKLAEEQGNMGEDPNDSIIALPPPVGLGSPEKDDIFSEEFYTKKEQVPPWKINTATQFQRIPSWKPGYGTYDNRVSKEQLTRLVGKFLIESDELELMDVIVELTMSKQRMINVARANKALDAADSIVSVIADKPDPVKGGEA